MPRKFELPDSVSKRLTPYERSAVEAVIKKQCAVLFVGGEKTGKTTMARILRKAGVPAFAPEDIAIIQLGIEDSDGVKLSQTDKGYPILIEKIKIPNLVRIA